MRRSLHHGLDWPDRAWFGRPLGPAAVEGAVRGAIFGTGEGLALGITAGLVSGQIKRTDFDPNALAAVLAASVAFTAILCTGESISLRLATETARREARFLGGLLAVAFATMPVVAIVSGPAALIPTHGVPESWYAVGMAAAAFAFVEALGGPFLPGAERGDSFGRWGCLACMLGGLVGVVAAAVAGCGATMVVVPSVAFGLLVAVPASALSTRASRAVISWLEPGWRDRELAGNRIDRLLGFSRADWVAGRAATDPAEAERLRQRALEHAWNALGEAEKIPDLAADRLDAVAWLFELHLELGKLEDALRLLGDVPGREILRSEALRRSDPLAAHDLAGRELASIQGSTRTARRLRDAALAVMALACADLGRHEAAAESLESARRDRRWRDPLLSCHGLDAVAAYLAVRRP